MQQNKKKQEKSVIQDIPKQLLTIGKTGFSKPTLPIIELKERVKLTIPKKVLNQIKFLCSKIWEVEWSGVLFYSVKGEFGTPEFEAKAEYIYPMNKGTQTYTEFETDGSVAEFIMDNMEFISLQRGLIHSHNNMSTFFSGTDTEEIRDNSEFYNYYLSLIINNKGEMCAKIAFRGKNKEEIKRNVSFKGTNGVDKSFVLNEIVEKNVVFTYNCDIFKEDEELVEESYKERVNEIITISLKKEEEAKKKTNSFSFNNFKNSGNSFEEWERLDNYRELKEGAEVVKNYSFNHDKIVESFTSTIIALDNLNTDTLEANLKRIKNKLGASKTDKNETSLGIYLDSVEENYRNLYHSFFDDIQEEAFLSTLSEVTEILSDYATGNWVADELYCALTSMLEEMEEIQELTEKIQ